ncbi:MAG TPA: UbiA family prenyltransferase [Spirochaetia bacterium]|nr:UbiA family prenyltransferase [Spirochaetia bacterium]
MAKLWRILEAWRIGRAIMMALITGSTAYGFGASGRNVFLAGLAAASLALAGFYIDYLADWKRDRASGKMLNPIASGDMAPGTGLVFIFLGSGISIAAGALINPLTLLPMAGVILVVIGMAVGVLETPVLRAVSLGAIQGFYVLLGGLASKGIGWGISLTALFLFFAMTGGRVMGEVRDLPHDTRAGTLTIPQRYGKRFSSLFLLLNEVVAYTLALSVYCVGELGRGYLYCVLGIIGAGTAINLLFILNPTPRRADITNKLSFGVLGMLYVFGMFLGRITL